jgi:hypothetical protein
MGSQNRGQLVHFLGAADAGPYTRLAKGFSELSSSMNAQTKDVTYIDDSVDSTTTGYQRSWSVSGDVYTENAANELLFKLTYDQAKGDEAVVYLLNVLMWKPSEDNPTTVFQGYKQKCSWVPDNEGGGAGGDTVNFSGALNAKGDPVYGWATITKPSDDTAPWTAVFSVDEPDPPA